MQRISTLIFIYASIAFGVAGLGLVFLGGPNDNDSVNQIFIKILMACIFIILPAFALSVAFKYLNK